MAGLLSKIKSEAKKTGANKGKFLFVKEGEKKRIRFLQDLDDGMEIVFHDSFELGINQPCQELFGRECECCDDDSLRTRSQYAWCVWDYDAKEVKLFMFPMNNCSPIPAIVALMETYGTITDRDYVVSVSGKQQNKSYSVIPMDKAKFRNDKAKPLSQKAILGIIDKAYPPTGGSKADEDEDDDKEIDYSEMSAKQLYNLCEDRGIEVEPKMKAKYYIEKLEEYDEEHESEDDDWEDDDEEIDYSEMSAKELYGLCKERDIECAPKKPAKYYINLLEEYDSAQEDWGDNEDDDWEEE